MSGNCLLTRLKGNCNNDKLRKYNHVRFLKREGAENITGSLSADGPITVYSDGIIRRTNDSTEIHSGSVINTGSLTFTCSGTYMDVEGKYNITRIGSASLCFDVEELPINNTGTISVVSYDNEKLIKGDVSSFMFGDNKVIIENVAGYIPIGDGDVSDLSVFGVEETKTDEANIRVLISEDSKATGHILEGILKIPNIERYLNSFIVRKKTMPDINIERASILHKLATFSAACNVYGRPSIGLGNMTNLTAINLLNSTFTEDFKILLDTLHRNGKTSGKINLYLNGNNTINGTLVSQIKKQAGGAVSVSFSSSGWSIDEV